MTARSRPTKSETVTGPLLRSRAAQLTDYLRKAIEEKKLVEPVPGIRQWSQQLGVSRRTLTTAIRALQREGWLTVGRRGVRLNPARGAMRLRQTATPKLVRLLFFGAYRLNLHSYLETISALQRELARRDIELRWETCSPARLREIARQPGSDRELLVLASLPPIYQRLFAASAKPVVVLGEVAPGLTLPFVNVDQAGAVKHATFRLLQHGCSHVVLAHINVAAAGIRSAQEAFRLAGAAWTRHPVVMREVPMALDLPSLLAATRRLAAAVHERTGIIVLAPVPVSMVVTALWHAGVAVPRRAEVVALFHSAEGILLYPPPTHYPHPVGKVVRHLTAAVVEYFETGRRPTVQKTIPAEQAGDR
jgi:DNA-binding LacI/PurR family transcriptional regulator